MEDWEKIYLKLKLKSDKISNGIDLLEFLSKNNIMQSKSEARRAIANNGLKINNEIVKTEKNLLN